MLKRTAILLFLLAMSVPASGATWHVDSTASAGGTGLSWASAFADLQQALSASSFGDEIWVAAGTYSPSSTGDIFATFALKNAVGIYGGFVGGETTRDARDWDTNLTTLSGNLGGSARSLHVVSGINVDASAILDGFTIQAGAIWGQGELWGSCIYNDNGSPTINNVIVTGCSSEFGGAIANLNGSNGAFNDVDVLGNNSILYAGGIVNQDSSPTFTGGQILGNSSDTDAGALWGGGHFRDVVFQNNSGWFASPVAGGESFENVLFLNNSSLGGPGAVGTGGSATFTNVVFDSNFTDEGPGALALWGGSPVLMNVVFVNNSGGSIGLSGPGSETGGGALAVFDASPLLANLTFANNQVLNDGLGAAIYLSGSSPTIANSILWGNSSPQGSFPLHVAPGGIPYITRSIVQGSGGSGPYWDAYTGIDGGYNLDVDPLFMDQAGGNLRLRPWSPAVDVGSALIFPLPSTDLDGNPRVSGSNVDLGAYETDTVTHASETNPALSLEWHRAAPNPFNPSTEIQFRLSQECRVSLAVFDSRGRRVRVLLHQRSLSAGSHSVEWAGKDDAGKGVASGAYHGRLSADGRVVTFGLVMTK